MRGRRGRGFTPTYAISGYRHNNCKFESRSMRGVLDTNPYLSQRFQQHRVFMMRRGIIVVISV